MNPADQLDWQLKATGLEFVREYQFHEPGEGEKRRKWRFDFANVCAKLAVEVDGAIWTGGRHTRGSGVLKDCEKYSIAASQGWRIVRVAPSHVKSGEALQWVQRALWWKPEAQR